MGSSSVKEIRFWVRVMVKVKEGSVRYFDVFIKKLVWVEIGIRVWGRGRVQIKIGSV